MEIDQDRVTLHWKKYKGTFQFDEAWVSVSVPQGETPQGVIDAVNNETLVYLNRFNDKVTVDVQGEIPKCYECGSHMKMSSNGKYWNCTKAVLKKNDDDKWINTGCKGYRKI